MIALVAVTDQVNTPRYPNFKAIMAAKKKPVQTWSVADLGLDAGDVGLAGSLTEVLDAADLWVAPETIAARVGADAETAVLLALRRGSRVWAPLGRLLDQARPDRLPLDGVEVGELIGPVADALAGEGIEVLWPRDVMATLETRPTVASETVEADSTAGLRLYTLCTLRWRATVGG